MNLKFRRPLTCTLKNIAVATTLCSALVALTGCGGGGSGTPAVQVTVNGQAGAVSAAQGAILYAGTEAGGAVSPQIARFATTSGFAPLSRTLATISLKAFRSSRANTTGWTSISGTDLYYEVGRQTATTAQILLSTNGTSNNAGYIDETLVSGANGSYPIVIQATIHIIFPSQTITGSETLTIDDNSGGDFSITAKEHSSSSGVTVSISLTVQGGQVTQESMSITKQNLEVTYSDISATSSGFSSDFSVGAVNGNVTVNTDNSGNASATDNTGTWNLTWDANLNATLTAPDGTVTSGTLTSMRA